MATSQKAIKDLPMNKPRDKATWGEDIFGDHGATHASSGFTPLVCQDALLSFCDGKKRGF